MSIIVVMPRQGQSVESCIITGLNKKEGDAVKKGELLFSYETDKASFEETSPADGTVLMLFADEGDEVPVLERVMVIGEAGEDISALLAEGKEGNESAPEAIMRPSADAVVASNEEGAVRSHPVSPRARKIAGEQALDVSLLEGSGPGGRVVERDLKRVLEARPRMTSLAKKLASEQGMEASTAGSGLAGRARAVDLAARSASPGQPRPSAGAAADPRADTPAGAFSGHDFEDRKLSNVRKLIARSMHASLQNSAQLTHHLGADARKILELRKEAKAALEEGRLDINITLNDLVCLAVVKALKKFPAVNSHFLGDTIRYFNKVHLGLAVDTERGLMVPVVRDADDLSITGLAHRLKEVASACRSGSVNPDILSPEAATFTVSNLGNYGVEMFTPVINLPQSAILGVNTILPRPKDLGGGVYAFVPHIGLSLTYDHRALDGGEATRFLKQVAVEIETLEI